MLGWFYLRQELIQNAEDAGATQVKFLHDRHSYGKEKLHSKELAKFQVSLPTITCIYPPERGCTRPIFIGGGSTLRSNPLPFYIPFFDKKGTPFVYLLLTNGTPFKYLV